MTQLMPPLSFTCNVISPRLSQIIIEVPAIYVDALFHEACCTQQERICTYGFARGHTPLEYIQEHYKNTIVEHITEFIFKYLIINFLYEQIHAHKICATGEPRLLKVTLEPPHAHAQFVFEVSRSTDIEFIEWKHLPFKAPKRKNYKDIDRQVSSFIKEEQAHAQISRDAIGIGDWVCLDVYVLDAHSQPLLGAYCKTIWLKIGNEEADLPFQELLLGLKQDQRITSRHRCLQDYFSQHIDSDYHFGITVRDIVPHHYFCFEDFKHHFKLKTNKEVHQKCIEIFSFRHDLSQRRNIVEEALKLLTNRHSIDVPGYLILRQQKEILENLAQNPDYQVYKTQHNFNETIRSLAIKQVKEMILIDQLAYAEDIVITNRDVKAYLNFFKRQRTKEFVYFQPPLTKLDGQEVPIPAELIKRNCLREKTLNHLIYHLTRK